MSSVVKQRIDAIEREVNLLFERVPFGSHCMDDDGTYLSINALELAWLGYTREEIIGKKKLTDFLEPVSQEKYRLHLSTQKRDAITADLELDLIQRNGATKPVSLCFMSSENQSDALLRRRVLLFDLTETRSQQTRQLVSAAAFESLSGMFVTDNQTVILQVNAAFTALTGYSAQEAVGQTPHLLSSGRHGPTFYQELWACVRADGSWHGEIWNRRKNGEVYVEWLSISSVVDAAGKATHYVGSFIDITASKTAQDQIAHMAYHDALTQLPNRRLLQDRLNHALTTAKRNGLHGAVLFIDLDHFKRINDASGHEAGDWVLIEAGTRLRGAVREGDSVARLGGDEFAVLLEELDADRIEAAAKAQLLGEEILNVLSKPYPFKASTFQCTASIGIDLYSSGETAIDLLQHADLAMYQSKKAGRNTLRFFDQTMQAALMSHMAMETELRRAIDQHQFQLYFQPQINQQHQIIGAEALLRWQHPEQGMVSPADFIPLAEETGLIVPIGQWVLETACAQLKAWERSAATCQLQLSVNVSAHQFNKPNFVELVTTVLTDSAIRPSCLKLEVTESLLLDVANAIAKMHALREWGVKFSMDDFGTGYSSLSSLTKLPLDQLKIDQSFVSNIGVHPTDAVIVQTIIAMAQTLNLEVIAEGVETQSQLAFLAHHGCPLFQGYLFGRPMPIHEFERLLDTA